MTQVDGDSDEESTLLILTPILEEGKGLPYYHPRVKHIAFRYVHHHDVPSIRIEVCQLESDPLAPPLDPNSRLYRTCLALLEALHRYGLGKLLNYEKRVLHDCIIPKEVYQDFYLKLRERYKHLTNEWHEATDPLKHVFEVSRTLQIAYRWY
jgi:tRNASer (uridine44-2'-O)-methyltransferase